MAVAIKGEECSKNHGEHFILEKYAKPKHEQPNPNLFLCKINPPTLFLKEMKLFFENCFYLFVFENIYHQTY